MLAGPILGNMTIWLLMLLTGAKTEDKPKTPLRPQPRRDGDERIPIRRNKSGTALSDFVRAMREEDVEPPRTASTLTPGVPTRIRIPSPKPIMRTPLFPLSAPLSAETAMSPRNPHLSTFSRQMNGSIDTTMSKSPRAPTNLSLPFSSFVIEEEGLNDRTSAHSEAALSLPSYSELIDEANSVSLPQSPTIQANLRPTPTT